MADVKTFDGLVEGFDKNKPFYVVRFGDDEHAHQARVLTAWLAESPELMVCATIGQDGQRHVYRSPGSTESTCGENLPYLDVEDGPLCPKCFIVS